MTIQEIRDRTKETSPHFFSPETLKFFGQRLSDFRILRLPSGYYKISAPIRHGRRRVGSTIRYFDPKTDTLHTLEPTTSEGAPT